MNPASPQQYGVFACAHCDKVVKHQLIHVLRIGRVYQCSQCNLVSLRDNRNSFVTCNYDYSYYTNGNDFCGYKDYFHDVKLRSATAQAILSSILQLNPSVRSILDIGCGMGYFVKEATMKGLCCFGVDTSCCAISHAKEYAETEHLYLTLDEFPQSGFDVLTLIDVIEHIADPIPFLTTAMEKLSDNGMVLAITPSISGWMYNSQRINYQQFKIDHVHYYTQDTLKMIMQKSGVYSMKTLSMLEFLQLPNKPIETDVHNKYAYKRDHMVLIGRKSNSSILSDSSRRPDQDNIGDVYDSIKHVY